MSWLQDLPAALPGRTQLRSKHRLFSGAQVWLNTKTEIQNLTGKLQAPGCLFQWAPQASSTAVPTGKIFVPPVAATSSMSNSSPRPWALSSSHTSDSHSCTQKTSQLCSPFCPFGSPAAQVTVPFMQSIQEKAGGEWKEQKIQGYCSLMKRFQKVHKKYPLCNTPRENSRKNKIRLFQRSQKIVYTSWQFDCVALKVGGGEDRIWSMNRVHHFLLKNDSKL